MIYRKLYIPQVLYNVCIKIQSALLIIFGFILEVTLFMYDMVYDQIENKEFGVHSYKYLVGM